MFFLNDDVDGVVGVSGGECVTDDGCCRCSISCFSSRMLIGCSLTALLHLPSALSLLLLLCALSRHTAAADGACASDKRSSGSCLISRLAGIERRRLVARRGSDKSNTDDALLVVTGAERGGGGVTSIKGGGASGGGLTSVLNDSRGGAIPGKNSGDIGRPG